MLLILKPKLCKFTINFWDPEKCAHIECCDLTDPRCWQKLIDLDISCIFSGFPCQPWSGTGKGQGFSDARSSFLRALFEILDVTKPPVAAFENVTGLRSTDPTANNTLHEWAGRCGYRMYHHEYDLSAIIPQVRKRIIRPYSP